MTLPQDQSSTARDPSLQVVRGWLSSMHDQGVRYCHFKSNAEVAGGLSGDTDMDVLGDRRQQKQTIELLSAAGFKRFKTAALMDYPAVDDYLACDAATGKLVHLHLHWQMIAGEPYLKGYRLPWEEVLLAGRKWDAESAIFVTSPEAELVLLLARAALKLRSRDRLRALLGRPYFRGGLRREYDWLVERVDAGAAVTLAAQLLGREAAELLKGYLAEGSVADREIRAFRRAAMPALSSHRTYNAAEARLWRWLREATSLWGRLAKRWRQPVNVYRRGPAAGGVVVALLGADGSGKSTQSEELVRWLRWKTDVMPLYLGSGDGPSSLPRKLLGLAAALAGRPRKAANRAATPGAAPSLQRLDQASFRRRLSRSLLALALAYERLGKLRRAFRARNRGMIVIADRFPQVQVKGYNDGPLLDELKDASHFWRFCSRLERRMYDRMVLRQPDLVIKLMLAPEVALERKPETPPKMVNLKTEAVRSLSFGPETKVVIIDASGPLKDVTLAVKHAVWDEL
jgi:thymidylate kinase